MKYHVIGKVFNVTFSDGVKIKLVPVVAEFFHDNRLNMDFRKSCRGCYFCNVNVGYCSGHPYFDEVCKLGGSVVARCSPEYRVDGKFIHYKIVKL